MSFHWYYVENKNRVGPVSQEKICELIKMNELTQESFVWRKGFENWKKIKDVSELQNNDSIASSDLPPVIEETKLDWQEIDFDKRIFTIKIGIDRGKQETEYGPYSLNTLIKLFKDNRINGKTMLFAPGMKEWIFVADIPIYEKVFAVKPPILSEQDRRRAKRKPFTASLMFHDNREVYDGICRDISIGGMQILIPHPPVSVDEVVSINVHPGDSTVKFVAKGKVVRLLDGGSGFSLRFEDLNQDAQDAIKQYIGKSDEK